MSCKDCDKIQEENKQGRNRAYIRIEAANVLIGACDKHFNILRRNMGQVIAEDTTVYRLVD